MRDCLCDLYMSKGKEKVSMSGWFSCFSHEKLSALQVLISVRMHVHSHMYVCYASGHTRSVGMKGEREWIRAFTNLRHSRNRDNVLSLRYEMCQLYFWDGDNYALFCIRETSFTVILERDSIPNHWGWSSSNAVYNSIADNDPIPVSRFRWVPHQMGSCSVDTLHWYIPWRMGRNCIQGWSYIYMYSKTSSFCRTLLSRYKLKELLEWYKLSCWLRCPLFLQLTLDLCTLRKDISRILGAET